MVSIGYNCIPLFLIVSLLFSYYRLFHIEIQYDPSHINNKWPCVFAFCIRLMQFRDFAVIKKDETISMAFSC